MPPPFPSFHSLSILSFLYSRCPSMTTATHRAPLQYVPLSLSLTFSLCPVSFGHYKAQVVFHCQCAISSIPISGTLFSPVSIYIYVYISHSLSLSLSVSGTPATPRPVAAAHRCLSPLAFVSVPLPSPMCVYFLCVFVFSLYVCILAQYVWVTLCVCDLIWSLQFVACMCVCSICVFYKCFLIGLLA